MLSLAADSHKKEHHTSSWSVSANTKIYAVSPAIQSCLVQGHPREAFVCASPILKLHAQRTGEAGKPNALKVGYAKVLHTFKNPQYSLLFFPANMIWEEWGHCCTWGSICITQALPLQQDKAKDWWGWGVTGHMERQGRAWRALGEVPNSWPKVSQTGNSKLTFRYFYSL